MGIPEMTEIAYKVLLGIDIAASLIVMVGCVAWLSSRWYGRKRKQQGWPVTEPFQRRREDSWQARHRRAYDKGKLRAVRRVAPSTGHARISKARIRKTK